MCFVSNRFHSRHLNAKCPDANAFDEMICDSCTLKNEFLNYYSGYCISSSGDDADTTNNTSADLNVTDSETDTTAAASADSTPATAADSTPAAAADKPIADTEKKDASLHAEIDQCIKDIIEINKNNVQTENSTNKRSSNTNDDIPPSKKAKLDEASASTSSSDVCRKPTIALTTFSGASFWPLEWRTKLCKCSKCLDMYKQNDVEFLLDDEDTVHAYQEKGKAKAENRSTSIHDETMRALSGMDHVAQIEAVLAYNKLKKKLTEFLTSFVSNEQVITAKDVDTFFQTQMGKKE